MVNAITLVSGNDKNAVSSGTRSYVGSVRTMEDNDGDGWMAIARPICYDQDGNKVFDDEDDPEANLVFPLSDVLAIRLLNDD